MLKFTEADHKKSAKWFMPAMVIVFLLATAVLLSGCGAISNVVQGGINATANVLNAIATN